MNRAFSCLLITVMYLGTLLSNSSLLPLFDPLCYCTPGIVKGPLFVGNGVSEEEDYDLKKGTLSNLNIVKLL